MAQALAQQKWVPLAESDGVQLRLLSAGVGAVAGQRASRYATQIVAAHGGDLAGHRSRAVADLGAENVGLFVTMTHAHREALRTKFPRRADDILTLSELAGREGDVADPFGGGPEVYAESYEQIGGLIEAAAGAVRERFLRAPEESTAANGGGHNPEKGPS